MPQAEGLPISDLAELGSYGLLAILLLKVAGLVNDKCILHRFENKKELVGDRNVGAGAVVAGSYIASGLVLAGAFSGRVTHAGGADGGSWFDLLLAELPIALAFFALGQVALVVLGFVYQAIQKEDVLDAIERDYEVDGVTFGGNAAAGIAFAGNMVALGVLLYGGARYDFVSWGENLSTFGIHVGAALVGLPLWRLLVDKIVLSKAYLAKEIYEDRNVNAALIESVFLVALAVILVFIL